MNSILLFITPLTSTIVIVLSFVIAILLWRIISLELRLRKLTKGSDGRNLESQLANINTCHNMSLEAQDKIITKLEELELRTEDSIRGIGHVRFNPFAGSGQSKPSFALALLNEKGNGIIISSLDTRGKMTLFSKDILDFKPSAEISEEEQKALDIATNSLHNSQQ